MRNKHQIVEDLLVLEESMNWSDNPVYVYIHDALVAELKTAIDAEIKEQILEEIVTLEGCIQSIRPSFVVDHEKIRNTVDWLRTTHIFKKR